ncbi:MAG TPA: ATP-grasp domain-containing protein [Gemmatimonadaceae bacterium]|nr:ATP-grasp domain-containing protein [Gemmatimonadaceae bacterium]
MFVIFVAPLLSPNAFAMVEAAAGLPDVRLGVVTHDGAESLRHLQGRVAHWRVTDVLSVEQLMWAARELAQRNGPVSRMFGAYEQLQVPLARAREALGVEGMSAVAANNFRDKARMKSLLRAHGLPCARHRLASSVDDAVAFAEMSGFPVVVKPPAGAGAQQTFRVENMAQLQQALAVHTPAIGNPVLLEEFIRGEEHSFETISIDGRAVWHSLTHYYPTPLHVVEHPWIQWCLVLPREVDGPAYDDIRQAGRRALEVLGMTTGLSHMEWFRRPNGSIAISEVAARPPGAQITTLVSRAHDIDFVRAWVGVMILDTFDVPARKYAAGAAFLRGQGSGRVRAVHGYDRVERELGDLVVDVKLPQVGAAPSSSYEGEGFIIVRHPETKVVEEAVSRIVSLMRVELG